MKVTLLLLHFLGLQSVTGNLRRTGKTSDATYPGEEEKQTQSDYHEERKLYVDTKQLLSGFQFAKARFLQILKRDYGEEFYPIIFEDDTPLSTMSTTNQTSIQPPQLQQTPPPLTTSTTTTTIGRHAFLQTSNAHQSWERIKRKFMMRILQYQITGQYTPFVWATAGDQVAAGRGNFMNQHYTAVLQTAAERIFTVAGLKLITRPYGMGKLPSAPEVAACVKALLGEDVDLVSWDFGETDALHAWKLEYFAHRVMRMKNRPALLVQRANAVRQPVVEHLTDLGMGVLAMDQSYMFRRMELFPDCKDLTEREIAALPQNLQWFKCKNMIEAGRGCMSNKFTKNGTCDERPYMTSWHPGWKWHAFQGNLNALFLTEILEDALKDLEQRNGADPVALLKDLKEQEETEFATFEATDDFLYGDRWTAPFAGSDVTAHQLADSPVYCHTARLPAQARIMGYVMDNPFPDDLDDFDRGIELEDGLMFKAKNMLLTYEATRHEKQCPASLKIDYNDFFMANGFQEDYQKLLVPNDIEMEVFGGHEPLGILLVCGVECEHGCPRNSLGLQFAAKRGVASMMVNDEIVGKLVPYEDCFLLQTAAGGLHWEADEYGQYTISIKIEKKTNYMRIGSAIVW